MPASDVPGWQLGYRFNAASYSSGTFADLTGNGNDMEVLNGAPVFETVNTHDGVKLDNTWNARFWHPNTWQGTVVMAMRMEYVSGGTLVRYPIDFARDGLSGTNSRLYALYFSGERRLQMTSSGAINAGPVSLPGTISPVALCHDQIRQNSYATLDGSTVVSGTADSGTVNGNRHNMGSNEAGAYFGSLFGDISNLTADATQNLHVFEMHFFEANPIQDAPSALQAYLAELAADYA